MNSSRHDDSLMEALATLPAVQPDPAQADETRARCRALLERSTQPMSVNLEPMTVYAICATYGWCIVRVVIR